MRRLLEAVGALKVLVRTGWSQAGVPQALAETVGSHTFESAVLALMLSTEMKRRGVNVSPERAATLALVHDFPEAVQGDLPPWTKRRCRDSDLEALAELELDEFSGLLREFLSEDSYEAIIARVADLLATASQGARYGRMGLTRAAQIGSACLKEAEEEASKIPELASLVRELFSWLRDELSEYPAAEGGWFD